MDSLIILVIVAVNACISISQESNAERALAALRQMSAPKARVIRNHQLTQLDTALLVPGDVIRLEAGDQVPADARLLDSWGSGGRVRPHRRVRPGAQGRRGPAARGDPWGPEQYGDRRLGDHRGRATAVVTATGMDTEMGKIASLLLGQKDGHAPPAEDGGRSPKTLLPLPGCAR